ncbi:MAG: nitrophenyl compound nitroreductase subunit ArsF family protein [Syntrophales bacterium]
MHRFILSGLTVILTVFLMGWALSSAAETLPKSKEASQSDATVLAIYFHGDYRCVTCKRNEQFSKEAVEKYFPRQIQDKKLKFRTVNVDVQENRHFIQDYQLYNSSLVIVLYRGDRQVQWKNLDGVWRLSGDRDKFYQYVKTEINAYLQESK